MIDRQTKMFIGVISLVASTFLMVNHLVAEDPIKDWWLAGILLVIAAVMFILSWLETQQPEASTDIVVSDEDKIPQAQEWIISKDVVAETPPAAIEEDVVVVVEEVIEHDPIIDEVVEKQEEAEVIQDAKAGDPIAEKQVADAVAAPEQPVVEEEPEPVAESVIEEDPAEAVIEGDIDPVGEATEPDDLTRVEGIGPKYQDALVAAGITTFAELAGTSLESIQAAAAAYGMRNAASMSTWAEQAGYAAKGDWDGLLKLQQELSGGRR